MVSGTTVYLISLLGYSASIYSRLFLYKVKNSMLIKICSLLTYFVIVREVACLTHSHGIEQSILMTTIPCKLIAAILPVTRRAHIFSIVLSAYVWTLSNLHNLFLSTLNIIIGWIVRIRIDFLRLFYLLWLFLHTLNLLLNHDLSFKSRLRILDLWL